MDVLSCISLHFGHFHFGVYAERDSSLLQLSLVFLTWHHFLHLEHRTEGVLQLTFKLQIAQGNIGPGLLSIPAMIRSRAISPAGNGWSHVEKKLHKTGWRLRERELST